jgi:hypothetical protein
MIACNDYIFKRFDRLSFAVIFSSGEALELLLSFLKYDYCTHCLVIININKSYFIIEKAVSVDYLACYF